jgi:hypothetical protein
MGTTVLLQNSEQPCKLHGPEVGKTFGAGGGPAGCTHLCRQASGSSSVRRRRNRLLRHSAAYVVNHLFSPTTLAPWGLQQLRGVAGHMLEGALQVCSPRLLCEWCIVWFQGYQTLLL